MFNALLHTPHLSEFVAVCHPVGHDVARYSQVAQPALLAFDAEDDGHPISVGRRMRAALPTSFWYEFKDSECPNWLEQHFSDRLLAMFASVKGAAHKTAALGSRPIRVADRTRVAGALLASCPTITAQQHVYTADMATTGAHAVTAAFPAAVTAVVIAAVTAAVTTPVPAVTAVPAAVSRWHALLGCCERSGVS